MVDLKDTKTRQDILDEIKRKRAAAAQSEGIVRAAEEGQYGDVGQGGEKGEFDDEINQDPSDEDVTQSRMSYFDMLTNYFTDPRLSATGAGIDLLGRLGAVTAPYTQKPLETISQGGDNIVQKAGKFLFEDAAKVAAKINSGVSFDELEPFEKLAIASVPAEAIPGLGLAPDILKMAKNFAVNVGKSALKGIDNITQPVGMTNEGITMPMTMSDEAGSGIISASDETKKIYPNLKYKTEADDFIKANYLKMSDEQMLKEMMKDSDKYFYEIPSSVKSLEQTNVEQTTESILDRTDTYKPFDPKSGEVTLKTQQQMADESLYSFEDDPSKLTNRKGYMEDTTGSIADAKANPTGEETWIDKAKGVYEGVSAVTGTVEEIFGGDEQPAIGGTYVADNMVGLMDTNKAAQIDYAANGFAGQPNWGMGNSDYYNSILQAIMNRADAYERFRPPSIRGT